MKRLSIFTLMIFAAAIFYMSCGDSNKPENKLEKLKKAVETSSSTIKKEAKELKNDARSATKSIENAVSGVTKKTDNFF